MTFDALIFDVDGTLADTEELHRQAFNEAFRAYGLEWRWDPPLYGELLQVTGGKERILSFLDRLQLEPAERRALGRLVPSLHAEKTLIYAEYMDLQQCKLRSGVARLMDEARAAGLRLAIASTTSPANIESLLEASFGPQGLRCFDVIVAGDAVARKKPAPDVYQAALRELRLTPTRAIAFEDSQIGVRSAKGAGLYTIATPNRWTLDQDFSEADLVLSSLGDPGDPLQPEEASRLGAQFLGLEQLATLHS